MTIEILKETLIETGNPFVWITDAGWFFNEQSGSVKYTAEQVLNVETFEDLAKNCRSQRTYRINRRQNG